MSKRYENDRRMAYWLWTEPINGLTFIHSALASSRCEIARGRGCTVDKPQPCPQAAVALGVDVNHAIRETYGSAPKPLLDTRTAERYRSGGTNEQGNPFSRGVASRAVTCRACGHKLAKGEPCWIGYHDFFGSGSHTSMKIFLHEACNGPIGYGNYVMPSASREAA